MKIPRGKGLPEGKGKQFPLNINLRRVIISKNHHISANFKHGHPKGVQGVAIAPLGKILKL